MDIRHAVPIDGIHVRSPPTKKCPNGRKVYLAARIPDSVLSWISDCVGPYPQKCAQNWSDVHLPLPKRYAVNDFVWRHFIRGRQHPYNYEYWSDTALHRYATWIVAADWNSYLNQPDEAVFWHLRYLTSFPYLDWKSLGQGFTNPEYPAILSHHEHNRVV